MKHSSTLLVLLAPAVVIGAQHIVDIVWDAGAYNHATSIAPGKFVEVCGKLEAAVRWEFEASAPLDFNIHYHQGKDVVYPARQAAVARGRDTLAVPSAQDYCWMWTNRSAAAVTLRLRLQR